MKWKPKWKKTGVRGVRYYEHPQRKHGARKDRYYAIRYQREGERHEEGLGWGSQGWTAEKANIELARLKRAAVLGEGYARLTTKRQAEKVRREKERIEKEQKAKEDITFGAYFTNVYHPTVKTSRKQSHYDKDLSHFKNWLAPVLGTLPFKEIKPFTIERLKKAVLDAGRSWRTAEYVLATFRQVWNSARRNGLVSGETPTRGVKLAKADNRRLRFLSHTEADMLLKALQKRDHQVYYMALVSLHAGLRASEIFNLTWADIDTDRGLITIRDPKAIKSRTAFMTDSLRDMFLSMPRGKNNEVIFTGPISNKKFNEMPATFSLAVDDCALNSEAVDRRQKVVFHTLRHTYASWLVESGVSLYTVKELMGHHSITMVQRYSHLGQNTLQDAVKTLQRAIKKSRPKNVIELKKKE